MCDSDVNQPRAHSVCAASARRPVGDAVVQTRRAQLLLLLLSISSRVLLVHLGQTPRVPGVFAGAERVARGGGVVRFLRAAAASFAAAISRRRPPGTCRILPLGGSPAPVAGETAVATLSRESAPRPAAARRATAACPRTSPRAW